MKQKKIITPNELSFMRWLAIALIGMIACVIISAPLTPYLLNDTDTINGIPYNSFFGLILYIPLFWATVLAIKFIGKTSLKDFILGVGGKFNFKSSILVFVLMVIGVFSAQLLVIDNIRLREVEFEKIEFLVVYMLLVAWMQTTWEELIFRGIFIRWACKNNVGFTKKSLIVGVISSLVFIVPHISNPEVTTQSGPMLVLVLFAYMFSGFALYVADLHFKSLVPGIIMHWVNNFVLFTLISGDVAAVPVPTLLVDTSTYNVPLTLLSVFITYLPVLAYVVIDNMRKSSKSAHS